MCLRVEGIGREGWLTQTRRRTNLHARQKQTNENTSEKYANRYFRGKNMSQWREGGDLFLANKHKSMVITAKKVAYMLYQLFPFIISATAKYKKPPAEKWTERRGGNVHEKIEAAKQK